MSVMISVLLPAVLLVAFGLAGVCWLFRRSLCRVARNDRALARARESAPKPRPSEIRDRVPPGASAGGTGAIPDEPAPTPAADAQPAATTTPSPEPANQETPLRPSPQAVPPPNTATIWNRSGDVLTHECDQTAFRRQVRQRIAEFRRGGPAFSVMLVQLDGYHPLMKTHGLNAVELALRATRLFLSVKLREMDVFDRYRHDCFAVLLPATCLGNAVALAERVRNNATGCLLPTKHGALEVTRSLGLAEVSGGDDDACLLGRAEAALKAAAGNHTCYHDGRSLRFAVDAPVPTDGPATPLPRRDTATTDTWSSAPTRT